MAIYSYKGKDAKTQIYQRGTVILASEIEVSEYLVDKGIIPIKIKQQSKISERIRRYSRRKLKEEELSFFCRQLQAMLEAGIDLMSALKLVQRQAFSRNLKSALIDVEQSLAVGKGISQSFRESKTFPMLFSNLLEISENIGNIEQILGKLSVYFERESKVKKKIQKALLYPSFVLMITCICILFLIVKVIPSFAHLFEASNVPLPKITQLLLGIGNFLQQYGLLSFILSILGVQYFALLCRRERVKRYYQKALLHVPLLGEFIKKRMNASFAETLAMLYSSGLCLIDSMNLLKVVMDHSVAADEMDHAIKELTTGHTLYKSLSNSRIYSPILLTMIQIGEEGGILESMLEKTAQYFNSEIETDTEKMITLIEPLLTIFIAFLVGGIMLSVVLPMLHMTTQFI